MVFDSTDTIEVLVMNRNGEVDGTSYVDMPESMTYDIDDDNKRKFDGTDESLLLPSPSKEGSILSQSTETEIKNVYDTSGGKSSPFGCVSNHTRLTVASTRSSRSTDTGGEIDNPAVTVGTNDTISHKITKKDKEGLGLVSMMESAFITSLESHSSVSHAPVIRNWSTKYDNNAEDNYNSYDSDDQEVCQSNDDIKPLEDKNEEQQQSEGKKFKTDRVNIITANSCESEKVSNWTCGVPELMSTNHRRQNENHEENDEKKDEIRGCTISKPIVSSDDEQIKELKLKGQKLAENIHDDDDESSMAWYISTFHKEDAINIKSRKPMKIDSKLTLSPASHQKENIPVDRIVSDKNNEGVKTIDHDLMAAQLDPLAFELDTLSSKEEEEVIFHEDKCLEDALLRVERANVVEGEKKENSKEEMVVSMVESDRNQGVELFSKVNDAIDAINALCLTPRANLMLMPWGDDTKVLEDQKNVTKTTSSSSSEEGPHIEVEFHQSSNDDEIDKIIVVDAVAKALKKSKDSKHNRGSGQKSKKKIKYKIGQKSNSVDDHLTTKGNQICSDAMEILMSLALMECCKSDNSNLPVELMTSKSTSASTKSITTCNNEGTGDKNHLALSKINISSLHERDSEDQPSQIFENTIEVVHSYDLGDEGIKTVEISDDSNLGDEISATREESNTCDLLKNSAEEKYENCLDKNNLIEACSNGKTTSESDILSPDKPSTTLKKNEKILTFDKTESFSDVSIPENKAPDFRPDRSVLESLDLMVDSDSFSVDRFCDNSFTENNPIRAKLITMMNDIEPKPLEQKLVTLPLKDDGKNSAFNELSSKTSSSFDLVLPLSSSESIPSPPQQKPLEQKLVTLPLKDDGDKNSAFNELSFKSSSSFDLVLPLSSFEGIPSPPQQKPLEQKLVTLPLKDNGDNDGTFNELSSKTSSSFDLVLPLSSSEGIPTPPQQSKQLVTANLNQKGMQHFEASIEHFSLRVDTLMVQSLILSPMHNLPSKLPSEESDSTKLPLNKSEKKRRKKKNKVFAASQNEEPALVMVNDYHMPSYAPKLESGKDSHLSDAGQKRKKKMLPHLAINKMIRSAKKVSTTNKKADVESLSQRTRSRFRDKPLRLDIGNLAKDSLRMERKLFSLPSPSSKRLREKLSSRFANDKKEDQENPSPNPYREPRHHRCVEQPSPKGIMRVKYTGGPRIPISNESLRVHFDEQQLADKVEKGIMIVSKRNRPIRKLEDLMQQITFLQNGYGTELDNLLGLKNISQGYIC